MASGTNEGVPANRSDLLALLHEKTGAQIIADHYSQWSDWSNTTNKSLNDLLQMIAKKDLESYWGSDGHFIYMRAIDLQKWNIEETPNRILEPLQKFADEQGYLDIDQIAAIMMLGERKATALQNNATYLRLPTDFNQSIYQNESIRQALIFYGSLNPLQKKAILNSKLDVASLTPKQRAAVAGCLNCITSVFEPSKRVVVGIYENGVRIDRPEPPSPDDPIKIRMTVQIDSSAITPELYMTIRKPTDSTENVLKVPGYTLEFEFQNGSIQRVIIPVMGKPVN